MTQLRNGNHGTREPLKCLVSFPLLWALPYLLWPYMTILGTSVPKSKAHVHSFNVKSFVKYFMALTHSQPTSLKTEVTGIKVTNVSGNVKDLTNKWGNRSQGTRMVKNKVMCQVVGNQTQGSVTFCLPASFMESCHHYMGQGNGNLGRPSIEVWVLYNCPGKEKSREPPRDLSLGRVFSIRCNKAPSHVPLVLCSETELVRATEYPSTNRGSRTVMTALRLMLTPFILR